MLFIDELELLRPSMIGFRVLKLQLGDIFYPNAVLSTLDAMNEISKVLILLQKTLF